DRIRFAFSNLTNPMRSYPDSQKMEEALRALELFVAIDCVETETTRLADYVLPSPSVYEVGGDFDVFAFHYPEVFYASRRAVVKAPGEAREDSMIYAELTQAMGLIPKIPQFLYRAAEDAVRTGDRISYFMKVVGWIAAGGMKYFDQAAVIIALTLGKAMGSAGHAMNWAALMISKLPGRAVMAVAPDVKQHPLLSRLPVFSEFCTMDAAFRLVDEHPEGAVIAYSDEAHLMQRHIRHRDGKFHLWCEEIDRALKQITPEKEEAALRLRDGCNMILSAGRHSEGGMNSSMRNPATWQYRNTYTLAMNPEDAKEMGFVDGQTVRVSTNKGSLTIPVETTWQTCRGYCLIPHHMGLFYEGKAYGTHINLLTDHRDIDELTGNSRWRYTPCRVEAV
ncbi:MAG: molybdopterin-dependent oxidoreductase, partial [Oscillospiraceae bacterium]|nr:molybdopterin-dependent oxidoreductase [Oscillospiraceae bacterium]